MLDRYDSGPRAPLFTKTATVIKMDPSSIKSQYTGSPESIVHLLTDVDFDGDRRIMRMRCYANEFPAAALMRAGEEFRIEAHSFKGDEVSPVTFRPLWPHLREAPRLADGEESPRVTTTATVVHKVLTVYSDHQRPETVVRLRLAVPASGGIVQSAFCSLNAYSFADACLAEEGYPVEISFIESHYYPGKLTVNRLRVDWAAVLRAEAEAAGKK